jgi:hypothetical protein
VSKKKVINPRLLKVKTPLEKQELILHWKRADKDCWSLYTNLESVAAFFLTTAHTHRLPEDNYVVSAFGLHMTIPIKLLSFQIPFRRPYVISEDERHRRREWCRKIGRRNTKGTA